MSEGLADAEDTRCIATIAFGGPLVRCSREAGHPDRHKAVAGQEDAPEPSTERHWAIVWDPEEADGD